MKTRTRACERRQWVRFAWIGEHDGALRVNGVERSALTVEEVNAACNVTIILARMVRNGCVARYNKRP